MTTVSEILENLDKWDGLELSKLEKSLKLTKKLDRDNLGIAIKALEKIGLIKNIEDNKFLINREIEFIRGRVRCSSKGYCFVVREDQGEDIYIRESNINNAWHGDYVIVLITKQALKRRAPEGSIKCVLKRYNDKLLAKVDKDKTSGELKAYPLDDRITSIIDVECEKNNIDYQPNKEVIYEIQISKFPIAQYNAIGSIVRELPLNAGEEGDIEILLSKNNIFKDKEAPKVSPKKIPLKGREDLTNQSSLLFKSWESSNSPSLPALYSQPHDGGFKIWLHSPAVSERINMGSKLDDYLKNKGEVICLGNSWLDYLSKTLTSSSQFKINEDCEAISLMIEINGQGEITDWKFSLSIIKPVNIITDNHLKSINKRKSTSKSIPIALKHIKDNLEVIYNIIHASKLINDSYLNSIKLDQHIPNLERLAELQKVFPSRDFHGWIKSFDCNDPQSILDSFIRLSNNILSRHLVEFKLPFIYKQYDDIEPSSINELTKSILAIDNKISVNIDGTMKTNELIKSLESSSEKKILHKLFKHVIPGIHLKLYKQNIESEQDVLNDQFSTKNIESPWCCPSLNYWNIFNQFMITTLLNDGKNKSSSRSKDLVELGKMDSWNNINWEVFSSKLKNNIDEISTLKLVQHLNEIRKQTKSFRNNIISIAQCREAQKVISKEVNAVITGVQSYGFFAEIDDLTSEGLVHVSTLGDDWYEYRSRQNLLIGRKNKKTYQLGQKVNVRVLKVDILKNQIDLELVNNDETEAITNNQNPNETKKDK